MTVSTTSYLIQYAGTGSTTAFATGFEFIADTDLVVILTDSSGVDTTQVITTNYTVAGAGVDAGGTVTMLVPPASGETLTIYRNTALTQGTDYTEFDPFPADSHEQALDKLTLISQETSGRQARSIQFRESEDRSGGTKNSYIPSPDTGKFLGWDANGNLVNQELAAVTYDLTVSGGDAGKVVVVNGTEDGIEVGALPVSSAATASTIASRDASGRIKVADPSAAQDAASKTYVDAGIAAVAPTLLNTTAITAAASIDLATIFSANTSYRYFLIAVEDVATGGASIHLRVSIDGSTFESGATDYRYSYQSYNDTGTWGGAAASGGAAQGVLGAARLSGDDESFYLKVTNPHSASKIHIFRYLAERSNAGGNIFNEEGIAAYDTADDVTGFQLLVSSGTFAAQGNIKVYGSNVPF